ncbi:MAG: winged helix-turn-helix domain-containing protein [Candidatus Limnocylindria bacterium]
MAIPDFQTLMLPVLRYVGDGEQHSPRDAIDALADEFGLTEEERAQRLRSGPTRTASVGGFLPEAVGGH